MTESRLRLGRAAEELAARRLEVAGMRVIARNARIRDAENGLVGEIDLVAWDEGAVVFVEVKAGREGRGSGPERAVLAVGYRKQRQIRRLARAWLSAHRNLPRFTAIRFDVVGVTYGTGRPAVEWIRGAF